MKTSQKIYLPFKRLIGIIGSIIGILFCAVLLWWWIFIVNCIVTKGHPIFVQLRIGKNEKVFKLLKFRSMKLEANPDCAPYSMTKEQMKEMETGFGRFLRKSSFDETLQLLNIFIGQMSFIGPRPGAAHCEEELVRYRKKYSPSAYDVKPGLSGLAQVKLNRSHDPAKKALLDHQYASTFSLWLDIKIVFLTIAELFKGAS